MKSITVRNRFHLRSIGGNPTQVLQLGFIWLATLIAFWPTFGNGFQMEWDDQWMLINHELVNDPTWENWKYYLTHYVDGQYFPLNQFYYVLLFQVNGFDPFVYHSGSLVLHMLNTGLVYSLVHDVLKKLAPDVLHAKWMVFGTTVLFAIHPLQVEAVAWISASKVLLFASFTLAALLLYLKYLDRGNHLYLVAVAICYLLGFMSKEQMIILPLILVLFDVFFRSSRHSVNRLVLEKIPFVAIALVLWYYAARSGMGTFAAETYPWHQRVALGSYCYFTYWFRFLAPVGLLHFYDYPIRVGESLPILYYLYIVMSLLLCYGIYEGWKSGTYLLVFCLLFSVINLFLVLHIVPSPRTYMAADRFVYLPMIGMGLLLSWGISQIWSSVPGTKCGLILGLMAGILILLGIVSFRKTEQWRDSLTLKKEVREYLDQKKVLVK